MSGRHRVLSIGPISLERAGTRCRVTAEVGGERAWFESDDVALAPAPEAFGSAFLIPALHHRAHLRLTEPVDALWLGNVRALAALPRRWWHYPAWPPEAAFRTDAVAPEGSERTALFFSGGVDSFYALLRGGSRVDLLVTLQGFDFRLDDLTRAQAVDATLRAVAGAVGARAAMIRTNVREHPLFRETPWERAHGGVLGAVAHLLAPEIRSVWIAASAPGDREIPWGQHWRIDPLWSSSRTRVVHAGRGLRRLDKLRAIAAEPLVREHLRVCWQNRAPVGNCSTCAKCVLAMLILESCGELERSRVFAGREGLAARIAALRKTPDRIHTFEEVGRSPRLDPAVVAEVRALVRRSRRLQRPDVRLRRALVKWVLERARRAAR